MRNITELRVNDVSVLNSSSVRCAESVLQSNIVHIMISSKGDGISILVNQ